MHLETDIAGWDQLLYSNLVYFSDSNCKKCDLSNR